MKKIKFIFVLLASLSLSSLYADDHVMQAPTLIPLETLQCNFNGNKDVEDLYKICLLYTSPSPRD